MKEIKKKLGMLLFGTLLCLFAVPVMANGDVTEKKEITTPAQSVEHSLAAQADGVSANQTVKVQEYYDFTNMVRMASEPYYLTEVLPKQNSVVTKGDRLFVKFYARDTWENYYTKPLVSIFNSKDEVVYLNQNQETVSTSGQDTYSGYLSWNTRTAAPGRYVVYIVNAPCYSNGQLLDNWDEFDCPYIKTDFTLKAAAQAQAHTHAYGAWKTVKAPTVFATGKKESKCKYCNAKRTKTIAKLKPTIKLSATKKVIARKKSYTLKITKLAKGDSVKYVKIDKKNIATVTKFRTNQYKITGKKKGSAVVTVVLKSGKKATCKITVK